MSTTEMVNMLPIFFDDVLSIKDCQYLINVVESSDLWIKKTGDPFWNNRSIDYWDLKKHDPIAANILLFSNIEAASRIKSYYGVEQAYPDIIQIVRWFDGMEQPTHWDDMTDTPYPGLEYREFGSIIYLNDTYSGGQTYYPNYNLEISPKAGRLAIHKGTKDHLHGVKKIEGGTRYTIASFWSQNQSRDMFRDQ